MTPDIIDLYPHGDFPVPGYKFEGEAAKERRGCKKAGYSGPDSVVVHAIAEYIDFGAYPIHASTYLKHAAEGAHTLVTPTGVLLRTTNPERVAWHCRARRMNWRALGIELLVPGVHNYVTFLERIAEPGWITQPAYEALVWEVTGWARANGIDPNHIYTHQELDPKRKRDPGPGLDIVRFREVVGRALSR